MRIGRRRKRPPRHVCVRCYQEIDGNDYRFRGAWLGEAADKDGLVYEHFPRGARSD